ncbi:Ditrans,polycis-undecaprenyl-diphosphate synthase ((2E,6E)-farnesyl-diphosphate specific) [Streptomyces microflavus]
MNFRDLVYRLYARRVEGRLDHDQVPKHIGVILDGNRRWAKASGGSAVQGHQAGADKISELLGWCSETDVEVVTLWMLSTDNFDRPEVIEEVLGRGMLEVLPLTHIRGRSLHDAFVIVDEAQSLERNVLLTVLSRIGANSRVVLTHDVAQRDNLRVGRYDGVVAVVEKLKGHPLFAHVTLTRSERSRIAALVTEMLEEGHI